MTIFSIFNLPRDTIFKIPKNYETEIFYIDTLHESELPPTIR